MKSKLPIAIIFLSLILLLSISIRSTTLFSVTKLQPGSSFTYQDQNNNTLDYQIGNQFIYTQRSQIYANELISNSTLLQDITPPSQTYKLLYYPGTNNNNTIDYYYLHLGNIVNATFVTSAYGNFVINATIYRSADYYNDIKGIFSGIVKEIFVFSNVNKVEDLSFGNPFTDYPSFTVSYSNTTFSIVLQTSMIVQYDVSDSYDTSFVSQDVVARNVTERLSYTNVNLRETNQLSPPFNMDIYGFPDSQTNIYVYMDNFALPIHVEKFNHSNSFNLINYSWKNSSNSTANIVSSQAPGWTAEILVIALFSIPVIKRKY